MRRRLEDFTEVLRSTERSPEWPIYGALIIDLRNIVDAMGGVARANPISGNRLPLQIPQRRAAAPRASRWVTSGTAACHG